MANDHVRQGCAAARGYLDGLRSALARLREQIDRDGGRQGDHARLRRSVELTERELEDVAAQFRRYGA